MNKKIFLATPFIFAIGGFVAGFISLAISSVAGIFLPSQEGSFPVFVLVVIEEATKLAGLYILLMYDRSWALPSRWWLFFGALLFGAGFGIFELVLIFLKLGQIPQSAFAVGLVHLMTGIFLFFAIYAIKIRKKELFGYFLVLLAVAIHLCYNIFVMSI